MRRTYALADGGYQSDALALTFSEEVLYESTNNSSSCLFGGARESADSSYTEYNTDAGPIQWALPGGRVEFGESLRDAGLREFTEETGLSAEIVDLLDVSEVILPDRPWHSITITFLGKVIGGILRDEIHPMYGSKTPKWFSLEELDGTPYYPPQIVRKALSGTHRT